MAEFLCSCGEKVLVAEYSFTIKNGKTVYMDKYKKPILCKCGEQMAPEKKDFKYVPPSVGQPFSSKSKEAQKAIMKKRSHEHSVRTRDKE